MCEHRQHSHKTNNDKRSMKKSTNDVRFDTRIGKSHAVSKSYGMDSHKNLCQRSADEIKQYTLGENHAEASMNDHQIKHKNPRQKKKKKKNETMAIELTIALQSQQKLLSKLLP